MVQLYQVTLGTGEEQEVTPECVRAIVEQYPDIFGEPEGLPPRRSCDHHIPLIPGAQPVNIRQYRHKPERKTENEEQVAELLKQGIIRRSTSPFASPVILVKKKDGTWRLCIDYRHLNDMTSVAKFPIPVIEELLDELHGAVWFSKLDSGWLPSNQDRGRRRVQNSVSDAFQALRVFGAVVWPGRRSGHIQRGNDWDTPSSSAQVCPLIF